jgi:hypothetical protein
MEACFHRRGIWCLCQAIQTTAAAMLPDLDVEPTLEICLPPREPRQCPHVQEQTRRKTQLVHHRSPTPCTLMERLPCLLTVETKIKQSMFRIRNGVDKSDCLASIYLRGGDDRTLIHCSLVEIWTSDAVSMMRISRRAIASITDDPEALPPRASSKAQFGAFV